MKKPARRDGPKAPPQPPRPNPWPRLFALGLCLVVSAAATWAVFEYVVWNRLPALLVGKWVVEGGDQDGATFDFLRDGRMVGRINVQGKQGVINARVKVEGVTLFATTRNPTTGQDETRTQIIKSLTNRALVLQDDRGNLLSMVRAD